MIAEVNNMDNARHGKKGSKATDKQTFKMPQALVRLECTGEKHKLYWMQGCW